MLPYDLGPPAPSPASKCKRVIHTGSRKTERWGGVISHVKGGGPKPYDSTETLVLYIPYSLYVEESNKLNGTKQYGEE